MLPACHSFVYNCNFACYQGNPIFVICFYDALRILLFRCEMRVMSSYSVTVVLPALPSYFCVRARIGVFFNFTRQLPMHFEAFTFVLTAGCWPLQSVSSSFKPPAPIEDYVVSFLDFYGEVSYLLRKQRTGSDVSSRQSKLLKSYRCGVVEGSCLNNVYIT